MTDAPKIDTAFSLLTDQRKKAEQIVHAVTLELEALIAERDALRGGSRP